MSASAPLAPGCELVLLSAFNAINVYIHVLVVPCECKYPYSFIQFFMKHFHVLMPEDMNVVSLVSV